MSEKKIPTPVVLAVSSAMIAVGVTALFVVEVPDAPAPRPRGRVEVVSSELRIDDSTPERVAESFYDAWRRRAWDQAESIATGEARQRVLEKRAADELVSEEDREMARQTWERLAGAPLEVYFTESRSLDGGLALRGIAAYDLVHQPYRREVEFVVTQEDRRWRVERMTPGRIVTPMPRLLGGAELEPEPGGDDGEDGEGAEGTP